jgi:hypothetical protein
MQDDREAKFLDALYLGAKDGALESSSDLSSFRAIPSFSPA